MPPGEAVPPGLRQPFINYQLRYEEEEDGSYVNYG